MRWKGEVRRGMAEKIHAAFEKHKLSHSVIRLVIDSPGGSVREGERVIRVLQAIKATHRLSTVVMPGKRCGSMCVFIYVQGEKRFAAPASIWLFHEVSRSDKHTRKIYALDRGQWVLCDRFTDSTLAYQGYLGDVEISLLRALERVTIAGLRPDLTFILDIDPEIGMARAAKRRGQEVPDRFEAEGISFHRRLRDAYRQIAANEPDRCVVIDAAANVTSIASRIAGVVMDRFGLQEAPLEVYIP